MTPKTIVRALDVGYGNTKYSTVDTAGNICFKAFRSLAPTAEAADISAGALRKRDTVRISVGSTSYEIGPDAELATDPQHAHVSDDSYVTRPEYRALCLGALAYMQASRIDVLVVGLPVSRMESHATRLRSGLGGHHKLDGGTSVEVKRVIVVAQPVGGALYTALSSGQYNRFREQTTLTIDIGAGTNDALVSRGLQALPKRCATHPGGTGAILRQLADTVRTHHGVECTTLALDKALRTGTLRVSGRTYPVLSMLRSTKPVVDQAINALMSRIGTVTDIDRIVLIGGGAPFFQPGIQKRFPDHEITVCNAGIFANVRGFQMAGERLTSDGTS